MITVLNSLPQPNSGYSGRGLTTTHGGGTASDFPNPSPGPLYPSALGQVNLSDQLRDVLKEMGLSISPMYRHTVSSLQSENQFDLNFLSILLSPKMSCRLYVVAALYGPYHCWEQEQVMATLEEYWTRPQDIGSEFGSIPTMPDEQLRRNLAAPLYWQGVKSERSKVNAIPSFTQITK